MTGRNKPRRATVLTLQLSSDQVKIYQFLRSTVQLNTRTEEEHVISTYVSVIHRFQKSIGFTDRTASTVVLRFHDVISEFKENKQSSELKISAT